MLVVADDNEIMTAAEVAKMLKIHPESVTRKARAGQIPCRKRGQWRFLRSEIMGWLGKGND